MLADRMRNTLDSNLSLVEKICDIADIDSAQTLHDKLATLGAKAIIEALENFDNLSPTKQNEERGYHR
jgi:methionyl-tRNA formyltransferase